MGTSSARRGPTTALWRAAKGAATRYLSPEGGGELNAREVVARYLAALKETPGQGDRLAVFRFTRKVGQELGAFWEEVNVRGRERSLQERGLGPLVHAEVSMLAQGLSEVLAGLGGGLEEAAVRTTLALVLRQALQSVGETTPANLVRQFLAAAVTLRLALDLGEPLEAAAGSYGRLKLGFNHIKQLIEVNVPGENEQTAPPASPDHWQGLAGWIWVTEIMAGLMKNLE
ncbi:MAG: hypothetical protein ACYC6G_07580 [Desulfobaccales bacterium]